ncbi:uncharacterized protein LOC144346249 [Saccoglossus kowalevskii]
MVVIDTPGVFDTAAVKDKDTERKIASEITKCVSIAASQGEGLDAFILILNADDRFTKEHADSVTILKKIFGEKMMDYLILLFTRKDQLAKDGMTLDEFLTDVPEFLGRLLAQCKYRVITFNNKSQDEDENIAQRFQLVEMIKAMRSQNDNSTFNNSYTESIRAEIVADQQNYEGENAADDQCVALVEESSSIWSKLFNITYVLIEGICNLFKR